MNAQFNKAARIVAKQLHNDTVRLFRSVNAGRDAEGNIKKGEPEPLGGLQCNVQPIGGELVQRVYGLTVDASLRMFSLPDERLKLGLLVEYGGGMYKIVGMPKPRSMAVCLLEGPV